ncbi:hypothetical protein GGS21DRAFT_544637 [Xylaria nigripes]|nr:hypothetical protein GGS21DRAFT_544637 [Xylaria nigripes]
MKSNTTVPKTYGFNTAVIFGVGILDNGDIMVWHFSIQPPSSMVTRSSFTNYNPEVGEDALAAKMQSFKTGTADINQVEISVNSQNFVALKATWDLHAVNNNDESIYDINTTIQFAQMLDEIGNDGPAVPDILLDHAYFQCYDCSANNDPTIWASLLGFDVIPLFWVKDESKPTFGTSAAQAETKLTDWKAAGGLVGGGF